MNADPAVLAPLASFIREYHHALATGDRRFLAEHTTFPLPFAEVTYEMEVKAKDHKLATVEELVAAKDRALWPEVLVPKEPAELAQLRRGIQKCSDPKAPEVPDWSQGEPAFQMNGDEVTLTYLNQPCESETHMVILTFVRADKSYKLRDRAVRKGPR